MTIQDLGSIGELVAGIATIITLVYLAFQIRSNNKIARAQSLQSVLDGSRDRIYLPFYNNPEIAEVFSKGMTRFDDLSEEEQRRFFWIMNEWIFQLQHAMQLYNSGLLPQVDYDAWLAGVAMMVKTDGGTQCWKQMQGTITPTIETVLNEYLDTNPDLPTFVEKTPILRYGHDHDA